MKRIISLLLSVVMLLSITTGLDISAYALDSSGSCGTNVTFTYKSGTLTISGNGAMNNYTSGTSNRSPFYASTAIKNIIINSGVRSIGNCAFYGCTGLTNITIPDSVTDIGGNAFYCCTGLTSIIIPDSVTSLGHVFYGCTGLTSVTIPANISNGTFRQCTGLKSVLIGNNVTIIGNDVFHDCPNLTNIKVDTENPVYDSRNDCNAIIETSTDKLIIGCKNTTIPNSVRSIGSSAFYGCTGLTNITIPDSVTDIGGNAFYCCTGLTRITIPNSVTSIDNQAFYGCTSLRSATLSNNMTVINNRIFEGCTGLTSITIPNNVTSIGSGAFCKCTGLKSITIPDSVTSIGSSAVFDCSKLINLYYSGSESDWSKINIDSSYNDILNDVTINYHYQVGSEEPCITHIWNSGTISTKPTCTNKGYKTFTCTVCGATRKEELSPAHSYNNGVITTQPTCARTGVKTFTCTVCGATKTESVPVTDNHTYNNGVITTAPTCVKAGVKTFTCTICGSEKTENVSATGIHTYNSGTITTQPSCTKAGLKKYKCINCSDSYTETVPALGHNYVGKVTKAATCTESGIKTYTCSRCSSSYTATIPALDHNLNTTIKKSTPYDYGYIEHVCSRCGYEHYKCIPQVYVKLSKTKYYYNGKAKKPKVLVYSENEEGSRLGNEFYDVYYPKGRKKTGKYTVKIVFKGDYYSGTIKKTFKIVKKVKKPAKVKGVSSVIYCDDYNAKVTYVAKWKRVKGASGYQIIRSGDDGGGLTWGGILTVKGGSKTSYRANCAYGSSEAFDCYGGYIKVRAFKKVNGKKIYGKWSKPVKTKSVNI